MAPPNPTTTQILPVFLARDFHATMGANMGDVLSFAAELQPGDIYQLDKRARAQPLSLIPVQAGRFRVADGSTLGQTGATVHLDSALMFMSGEGEPQEALVLVEVDALEHARAVYLMPLRAMKVQMDYQLVRIDRQTQLLKYAQLTCVSFTRGTQVALGSGRQRRVEALRPGDRIMTRDDGPQVLRWIGHSTIRAIGDFAPILITQGALNNANDLLVNPDHRFFVYQREDTLGTGRAELMVKARHLVNDRSVRVIEGGFVEYYQLLFDRHQIIFAEGIATESMLIDPRTRAVLPPGLDAVTTGHSDGTFGAIELSAAMLDRPDAAELLRRASAG